MKKNVWCIKREEAAQNTAKEDKYVRKDLQDGYDPGKRNLRLHQLSHESTPWKRRYHAALPQVH